MRVTAGLTSRRLRRLGDNLLVLAAPAWVRAVFGVIAALIITAAVSAGSFPEDFQGRRLPGTLLITALAVAAAWKAAADRRLEFVLPEAVSPPLGAGTAPAAKPETQAEIRESLLIFGVPLSRRRLGAFADARNLRLMTLPLGPGRRPDGSARRSISKLSLVGKGFEIYIEESSNHNHLLVKAGELGAMLGLPVLDV